LGNINGQQTWIVQGDPFTVTNEAKFARSGTQGVVFDGVSATATSWAWVDLLHTPVPAEPVIHSTVYVFVETDPQARGVTSAFGLDAYQTVPTFTRTAAVRLRADGNVAVLKSGALVGTTTTPLSAPDQWTRLDLVLNYTTLKATARVNGVDAGFVVDLTAGTNVSDIDLYGVPLDFHRAGFDDFSVTARRRGVALKVASASISNLKDETATVAFRKNGTDVFTTTAKVSENGFVLVEGPAADDTYDVVVKIGTHLKKLAGSVALTTTDVDIAAVATLTNGDIDGDNFVTVFDYDKLSAYFDKSSADSDWTTPDGDGIAPKDADLDRDGFVTVFDYDILSSSFDETGD